MTAHTRHTNRVQQHFVSVLCFMHTNMKKATSLGLTLLVLECILFVYWIALGMAKAIITTDTIIMIHHVVIAFHFPTAITINLVLEHYGALVFTRKTASKSWNPIEATPTRKSHTAYLFSWLASFLIVLGTDAILLIAVILDVMSHGFALLVILELIFAVIAIALTLLSIVWSWFIYGKMQKEHLKLTGKSPNNTWQINRHPTCMDQFQDARSWSDTHDIKMNRRIQW